MATVTDRPAAVPAPASLDAPRRRIHRWWSPLVAFVAADVIGLASATLLVGTPPLFLAAALVATVFGLRRANLYRRELLPTALTQVGTITMAVAAGALVGAAAAGTASRTALAFAAVAIPVVWAARAIAYAHERRATRRRPDRALVVGTGVNGQELVGRLVDHPEYGIIPLGFVDDVPLAIEGQDDVPLLGEMADLPRLVREHGVNRIFLDAGSVSERELLEVLDCGARNRVEVCVLPTLAQHLSTVIEVEGLAGTTVLSYRPSARRGISWATKRVVDVVGALAMLLVSAPVWLVTAAAIKLDSRGPVLYRQTRVGRYGREFTIFKFRSMQTDADAQKTRYIDLNEASGPYFKIESDPRVTRVGRVIRRFSIDEIPQVLNVLRGDMSLVGPRPALASEVAEYPEWFLRRLTVRPGLSGLWQVSGRFLVPFSEATRLDVHYVDHWSLGLDLQILARTPGVVLSGRGAR